MFDALQLHALMGRILADESTALQLVCDGAGVSVKGANQDPVQFRLVQVPLPADEGEPFWAIQLAQGGYRAVFYLHSADKNALNRCAAISLSAAVGMSATRAAGLYACPWCALPMLDKTAQGVPQPQAECWVCKLQPYAG